MKNNNQKFSSGANIILNLIPEEKKAEIEKNRRLKIIIRAEIIFTIILLVFYGVLFSFKYILNLNLAASADLIEKTEKAEQYLKIKDYESQFGEINKKISEIASLKKDQMYWSEIFIKLNNLVFSGISVNSLSTSDYSLSIDGIADTRADLILFKEKLQSEECFSDIQLPLSDLVDKNNIKFKISLNIKEECLKKQ